MIKNSEYNFKQAVARSDLIKSPEEHIEEVHERFAMEEEKWCMTIIGSNENCPQMIKPSQMHYFTFSNKLFFIVLLTLITHLI